MVEETLLTTEQQRSSCRSTRINKPQDYSLSRVTVSTRTQVILLFRHFSVSLSLSLLIVCRLPDAQLFIKRRLAFLQSLGKPADRAAVMSSISQCYHASGNIPTALDWAQQAVDASNDCDPDLQWRLATLKRQDEVASRQQAAISSITTPHRELVFPTPIQARHHKMLLIARSLF